MRDSFADPNPQLEGEWVAGICDNTEHCPNNAQITNILQWSMIVTTMWSWWYGACKGRNWFCSLGGGKKRTVVVDLEGNAFTRSGLVSSTTSIPGRLGCAQLFSYAVVQWEIIYKVYESTNQSYTVRHLGIKQYLVLDHITLGGK